MSAMILGETEVNASVKRSLSIHRDLPSGTKLKLEVGNNELNVSVPAGKIWDAQIVICISETDA